MREHKTHELKCWTPHFKNVKARIKGFEIRENDRGFQVGDCLWLREWNEGAGYTGDECWALVTHMIESAKGLAKGFCIMSIRLLVNETRMPVWRWQLLCSSKKSDSTLEGYLFTDEDHCFQWFEPHSEEYCDRWRLRLVKAVRDDVESSPIVIEAQPTVTIQEFYNDYHARRIKPTQA